MKQDEPKYCYRYPHPAMTADCVIFGFDGKALKVLLVERGLEPYLGSWALPGGFMKIDETIEQTARRELEEETGLKGVYMEQFRVYSTVNRDPRERVVTVVFIALVRPGDYSLVAGDDAADARWFDVEFLPPMAFDHTDIIEQARAHLTELLRVKPIAFELLNRYFSLAELQRVYEAITGRSYDRRNFQRKALQAGMLAEADAADEIKPIAERRPEPGPEEEKCMAACCPTPEDVCACAAPEPSKPSKRQKRSKGRPGKLFRFIKPGLFGGFASPEEDDDPLEDASTKDLFSF